MNSAAFAHPAGFPSIASWVPSAFDIRDRHIGIAVALSVLVHGMVLGWMPGRNGPASEVPLPLQVRLTVPEPRPETAAVLPAPTFAPSVAQAPVASRREDLPAQRSPVPLITRAVAEAAPDAVLPRTSEPVAVAASEALRANPAPIATRAAVSAPALEPGALTAYGRELAGAVATRQRYPRVALVRQWQGTAVLQLELAADGRLLGVHVLSSSGHETLDRQALEMVREAVPLPPLPAALAGRALTVDVPVVFRIAS